MVAEYPDFEELAHTADLQILVYGKTLEELFKNAGKGMYAVSGAEPGRALNVTRPVSLKESDRETLLISYLEELILLADQRMIVVGPDLNISLTELSGDIPLYSLKKMKIEIKAVTYYEMEIIQKEGVYSTKITFDI